MNLNGNINTNFMAGAQAISPASPYTSAANNVFAELDRLHSHLGRLVEKLSPVMAGPLTPPPTSTTKQPIQGGSQIVLDVLKAGDRITAAADTIHELINRLEV